MSPDYLPNSRSKVIYALRHEKLESQDLLHLLENRDYEYYHPEILSKLHLREGLKIDDFNGVHTSDNCRIEEIKTGEEINLVGECEFGSIGFGKALLKKLRCTDHLVTSVEFFDYENSRHEGPFR